MKKVCILAVLTVMLVPVCAGAAEQGVAFVNASVIFEQYSAAKEAEETYERELEELNRQVTEMETELRALGDTLEARKYLFSEARLKEKRSELETKQQEYLRFRQDAEMKAAKRNDELTRPLIEAIEAAAKQVAEKEGFDLVLDAGQGIVVYSKPELDLTDKVLQTLEESRGATE
jgi:outer membrane protein